MQSCQIHSLINQSQQQKNETEVVLRLSANMVGDNETNFPHKLLLTNNKLQIFVKPLQIIYWEILNYQKLSYQR